MTRFPGPSRSGLPRAGLSRLALLALPALALAACSHGPTGDAHPATIQPVAGADLVGDAVAQLHKGDAKAARHDLEAALKRDPGDARAQLLLQTITDDPQQLLGRDSYVHTMAPGETLTDIAAKDLGDPDKFYALARFNAIAVPDSVAAGQTINIPGRAPAPGPAAPPASPEHATPHREARPERTAPAKATPAPAPVAPAAPVRPAANPARAAQFRSAGLQALSQGKVDRAVALLHQAAVLDPGNPVIQRDLSRAVRIAQTVHARR